MPQMKEALSLDSKEKKSEDADHGRFSLLRFLLLCFVLHLPILASLTSLPPSPLSVLSVLPPSPLSLTFLSPSSPSSFFLTFLPSCLVLSCSVSGVLSGHERGAQSAHTFLRNLSRTYSQHTQHVHCQTHYTTLHCISLLDKSKQDAHNICPLYAHTQCTDVHVYAWTCTYITALHTLHCTLLNRRHATTR